MKKEWFVTYVTPIGSPDRAERHILGMILDICYVIGLTWWSLHTQVVQVLISSFKIWGNLSRLRRPSTVADLLESEFW